jgi:gamma-glutamyl:cysteine ligase YbdK (ATP-grasp superfamily)
LQSVHLNLPFAGDDEFGRLHAAIRLLLPILPALAASSPVADGRLAGPADLRLDVYRKNSLRVPLLTGDVIPEPVFTRADYERQIFQPMYDQIAPLDPAGVLRYEWLNARGAIARFDRHTIEIRVLDVQECPAADLAICTAIGGVLQAMTTARWSDVDEQQSFATQPLAQLLLAAIQDAEQTVIENSRYLAQFGFPDNRTSAGELWQHLVEQVSPVPARNSALETILNSGPLSRRIQRALSNDMSRLPTVYGKLCDCLAQGQMFT